MRSAPTLKIWMTPFASVAMLEKLTLLKIARCKAPVLSNASAGVTAPPRSVASGPLFWFVITCPRFHSVLILTVLACHRLPVEHVTDLPSEGFRGERFV